MNSAKGLAVLALASTYTPAMATKYLVNGPIGEQGQNFTDISGVNTAGTVRVNMLANLEALLNIIANFGELIQIGIGAFILCKAIRRSIISKRIQKSQALIGITLIASGLATPAGINYFVASCRDANLFS